MSAQPKYRLAGGEPSRKWKYSAGSGASVGGAVGLIVAYFVGRLDPTMPNEVVGAVVWLTTWLLTQGSMMIAGYLARPSVNDKPIIDTATTAPPVGIPE